MNFSIYILISLFFISFTSVAGKLEFQKANQALWSIFQFSLNNSTQKNIYKKNTGFFIGQNHFVTHLNSVFYSNKNNIINLQNLLLKKEDHKDIKIKSVVAISALHNLVILETTNSVKNYLKIREKDFTINDLVFLSGYSSKKTAIQNIRIEGNMRFNKATSALSIPVHFSDVLDINTNPILDSQGKLFALSFEKIPGILIAKPITKSIKKFLLQTEPKEACLADKNINHCVDQALQRLVALVESSDHEQAGRAKYQLGNLYKHGGLSLKKNTKQTVAWYKEAALDHNHALAQYRLAMMYSSEKNSISKNYEKAISLFQAAADQNCVASQHNLAVMYDTGEFISRDVKKAGSLFQTAADQNYAPSQYYLGIMHYYGEGVSKKFSLAIKYLRLAENQGYDLAWFAADKLIYLKRYEQAKSWLYSFFN